MRMKMDPEHEIEHESTAYRSRSRRKQADAIAVAVAAHSAKYARYFYLDAGPKTGLQETLLPPSDLHTSWQKEPGGA